MAVQRICNAKVGGSSPLSGTIVSQEGLTRLLNRCFSSVDLKSGTTA